MKKGEDTERLCVLAEASAARAWTPRAFSSVALTFVVCLLAILFLSRRALRPLCLVGLDSFTRLLGAPDGAGAEAAGEADEHARWRELVEAAIMSEPRGAQLAVSGVALLAVACGLWAVGRGLRAAARALGRRHSGKLAGALPVLPFDILQVPLPLALSAPRRADTPSPGPDADGAEAAGRKRRRRRRNRRRPVEGSAHEPPGGDALEKAEASSDAGSYEIDCVERAEQPASPESVADLKAAPPAAGERAFPREEDAAAGAAWTQRKARGKRGARKQRPKDRRPTAASLRLLSPPPRSSSSVSSAASSASSTSSSASSSLSSSPLYMPLHDAPPTPPGRLAADAPRPARRAAPPAARGAPRRPQQHPHAQQRPQHAAAAPRRAPARAQRGCGRGAGAWPTPPASWKQQQAFEEQQRQQRLRRAAAAAPGLRRAAEASQLGGPVALAPEAVRRHARPLAPPGQRKSDDEALEESMRRLAENMMQNFT